MQDISRAGIPVTGATFSSMVAPSGMESAPVRTDTSILDTMFETPPPAPKSAPRDHRRPLFARANVLRYDIAVFDLNLLVSVLCAGIFVYQLAVLYVSPHRASSMVAGLSVVGFCTSIIAGMLSERISFVARKRSSKVVVREAFTPGEQALLGKLKKRDLRVQHDGQGNYSCKALPSGTTSADLNALIRERIVFVDTRTSLVKIMR